MDTVIAIKHYSTEGRFLLPVVFLAIQKHALYMCKELMVIAAIPQGFNIGSVLEHKGPQA